MTVNPLYLTLLIICFLLSAFFSASEIALISLQRVRLEHLLNTKVKGARLVARLLEKPEKLLSTILLGNNLVNTAATALATAIAVSLWGERGILIAAIGMTVLLLVFAETTPKTVAIRHTGRLSLLFAPPIRVISWLFTPFVWVLSWIASGFVKLAGGAPMHHALISEEEIRTMITVGHEQGSVEKEEAEMLHKVFEFGNRPVREIMIPRTEVVAVEKGAKLADLLNIYAQTPMSRYPAYEENMDNVIGILSIKDVLMTLAKGSLDLTKTIDSLVRPAYFTPDSKRVSEVFAEMKDKNYHLAIVVDEYGGTAGIVTLSLLIEQVVGPIGDELAVTEKEYEEISENTYQIDGGMNIAEANRELELDLPEGAYETVAGFVLSILGRIPGPGERLRYKNLKLQITKMRGQKIEEILLTKEKRAAITDQVQSH